MNGFDPGPGWREVERPDAAMHGEVVSYRAPRGDEPRVRTWVREAPVPPLPTAPYTVIRVTWPEGKVDTEYVLLAGGEWLDVVLGNRYTSEKFARITGFDVLAEPRAVTAKAVLDHMRALRHGGFKGDMAIEQTLRDFGAAS